MAHFSISLCRHFILLACCIILFSRHEAFSLENEEVEETEEGSKRYYRLDSHPDLEITLQEERQDQAVTVSLHRFRSDGEKEPLILPLAVSTGKRQKGPLLLQGRTLAQGRPVDILLRLTEDKRTLTWAEPPALQLPSGSQDCGGTYSIAPTAERLEAATKRLEKVDTELNGVYSSLKKRLSPEAFSLLRENQRRWLRYRDHYTADGDNAARVGPGSPEYLQKQSERTGARLHFLRLIGADSPLSAASADGYYSNGAGATLAFYAPGDGQTAFFLLEWESYGKFHTPFTLSGQATAATAGSWLATAEALKIHPPSDTQTPVQQLEFIHERNRLIVKQGDAKLPDEVFLRRELTPATCPMRMLLANLPTDAFADTTEGINGEELASLVLFSKVKRRAANTDDSIAIKVENPHYLSISVLYGGYAIRRFAGKDGSALIAIATTNNRARSFGCWRWSKIDEPPVQSVLQDLLPHPAAADFFEKNPPASDIMVDYELAEETAEIKVSPIKFAHTGARPKNRLLHWDGYGFISRPER